MSLLCALPRELTCSIIEFTIPEGFENLLLSCRSIYECGSRYIASHNARRKWRRIVVGESRQGLRKLIYHIAQDPLLLQYIESVHFNFDADVMPESTHGERWVHDNIEDGKLKDFVKGSPFLQGANINTNGWVSKVFSGPARVYPMHIAVLLTLLVNVKSLSSDLDIWIAADMCKLQSTRGDPRAPLAKLRSLRIGDKRDSKDNPIFHLRLHLGSLSHFLSLESLEELFATNVTSHIEHNGQALDPDHPDVFDFRWPYPGLSSNLRSIELVHSCLNAKEVSKLLVHTPKLESFKYTHFDMLRSRCGWDAGGFAAAIGKHCGDQLKYLHIEVEALNNCWIHRGNERCNVIVGVVSMREFTNLQTVFLDSTIFEGPPARDRQWSIDSVPSLTQILPATVTTVHLRIKSTSSELSATILTPLIANFSHNRPTCLPLLDRFVIRSRRSLGEYLAGAEHVRVAAEAAGAIYEEIHND